MVSEVKPIRTEADYEAALEELAAIWGAALGSPEGDRLDVLATLIESYEAQHHPIDPPDPIALIEFVLEQRGLDRSALQPVLGPRGRVSEIMTRKRPLTLEMIRRLHADWGLPADVLVRPYPLKQRQAA